MVIKTNDTYLCTTQIKDKSDISKDFGRYDIFTKKDAISGFKSSPWADLDNLVNTPLDRSIFMDDITTFAIGFTIPYTLQ